MNTIDKKQRLMSTLKPKFCYGREWHYFFVRDKSYYPEMVEKYVREISNKRVKYLEVPICGTVGTPSGIAIATWACTLPNIKRIYICDNKLQAKHSAELSIKMGVPVITKNPRSLIPYDVLRTLGQGKVLFVYGNMKKFPFFRIDDLYNLNLCDREWASFIKRKKINLADERFRYKAEWLSDDEVVLH